MAKVKETVSKNNEKQAKKTKSANKKESFFAKFGKKSKEIFSELKKVSWPSFGKVVKNTGVVIAVVLMFLIVITGVDFGLSALLNLIV